VINAIPAGQVTRAISYGHVLPAIPAGQVIRVIPDGYVTPAIPAGRVTHAAPAGQQSRTCLQKGKRSNRTDRRAHEKYIKKHN